MAIKKTESEVEYAIQTKGLTKIFRKKIKNNFIKNLIYPKYRNFTAVDKLDLTIKKKEIFGLLGPNGAGKTTTIQMICGLLYPTAGKVFINGVDIQKNSGIVQKLGVMFSDKMLYNRLSGYHNLKYFAKLYRVNDYKKRIQELAELLDLSGWLNELVEHYSLGMRTKLAIARTLIHDPDILLLDEPTLGLDVVNSAFIRKLLRDMNKTILITTHYINEAEILCNRIGFLFKGQLYKVDTPQNLKQLFDVNPRIHLKTIHSIEEFIPQLKSYPAIKDINVINEREIIITTDKVLDLTPIVKDLSDYGIVSLFQEVSSLEEIFIHLIENKA